MAKNWDIDRNLKLENGEIVEASAPCIISASRSTDIPSFYADLIAIQKLTNADVLLVFFLPFGATAVLFLFMPMLAGSFFAIMEHELTHMLFAVLTFHKPRGLDVNQDVGGSFSFEGKGNWLIALAPYFFPTFLFVNIS